MKWIACGLAAMAWLAAPGDGVAGRAESDGNGPVKVLSKGDPAASAVAPEAKVAPWPVEVTNVEGRAVQVRDGANEPWRPAKVGMTLGERAEVRVGLKAALVVKATDGRQWVLDRLSVGGVADLGREEEVRTQSVTRGKLREGEAGLPVENPRWFDEHDQPMVRRKAVFRGRWRALPPPKAATRPTREDESEKIQ